VPLTFLIDLDSPSYNNDIEKIINTFSIIQNACASVKDTNNETQLENARCSINTKLASMTFNKDRRIVRSCIPFIQSTHFKGKNIWIIKPTGFNRGRGVEVFTSLDQMKKIIKDSAEGINENERQELPKPESMLNQRQDSNKLPEIVNNLPSIVKTRTFVIQKYIERPLLINKRKFDIRAWVLVTHELKCYFFKEGYLRMSSYEYKTDANNREIHLTNNAVQKNTEGYGHLEDGNQLSYGDFQEYINANFPGKDISVKDNLYNKMKEYVNLTLLSVRKKLNPDYKKHCFEIFGYDFMVDEEFNMWLIEINTNPCLEESSQLLKMLLPRMLGTIIL
jgi:Tubulin-tyrosine ligase family